MEQAISSTPTWIRLGEKFALIGMDISVDEKLDRVELPGGLTALTKERFVVPDLWREWLGTLRVENIENCTLFLAATMHSNSPTVLDGENQLLQRRVNDWFIGLTLVRKFTAFDPPFLASGTRDETQVDIRSYGELKTPAGAIVADDTPVGESTLRKAAEIGHCLQQLVGPWQSTNWRLRRCLGIYQAARSTLDLLDRIHQFTRCVEGLIVPEQGKTRKQFVSRTALFIGQGHGELMGELFDARSHFEHLHEYRYLQEFDRVTRIRLAELEAVSEWVARSCLSHILLSADLMAHFGSVEALNAFWRLPNDERQAIWGKIINPLEPLVGFNFAHVGNATLGGDDN